MDPNFILQSSSRVTLSPELMSCDLDQEKIVLQMKLGQYFSLNVTGRRILDHLKEPMSLEMLYQNLKEEFGISKEVFDAEVSPFLQALLDASLIIPSVAE